MSMFLSLLRNVLQILKSILLCLEEFSEHSKGGVLSLDEITVLQGRKLSLQKEVSLLGIFLSLMTIYYMREYPTKIS